jgi:predicted RNase H-like HicB family nuclease
MVLKIVLEPSDDGGFTATVPVLPGCVSEGETVEEAMANIQEAIELYLEPIGDTDVEGEGVLVKELIL